MWNLGCIYCVFSQFRASEHLIIIIVAADYTFDSQESGRSVVSFSQAATSLWFGFCWTLCCHLSSVQVGLRISECGHVTSSSQVQQKDTQDLRSCLCHVIALAWWWPIDLRSYNRIEPFFRAVSSWIISTVALRLTVLLASTWKMLTLEKKENS